MIKRTIPLFLAALLLLTPCFAAGANAAGAAPFDDGLLGIAGRGDPRRFPENSAAGVAAAAGTGIDGVLIDVSLTQDGVPVALEAGSAARMLDGAAEPAVSAYTLAQLQTYFLRQGRGGEQNPATELRVATLAEMLDLTAGKDVFLALRFDVSAADAVTAAVDEADAADRTLLFPVGSKRDVKNALAGGLTAGRRVMAELRSNIVFEVTGMIRQTRANGGWGLNLKTTNRYGINYYPSVLRRFGTDLRAVADTSDPVTAGARTDCEKWWDDLISRGYSVFITDDPEAFVRYKTECETARAALSDALRFATEEAPLPVFKKELLNDVKKAYDDAVREAQALLERPCAAARDMQADTAALYDAVKEIELHFAELTAGTAGVTVTLPRILLCVAAAAAVAAVQIYFYKKRKKG